MENTLILHGKIQAFADSELNSFIDRTALDAAKSRSPKGIAKAFTIAHEGVSRPALVRPGGPVTVILRWGAQAVESVKNAVRTGIQCFAGNHSSDNSHDNRKPVAEIIGRGLRVVGGKLHAVAVAWFPDPKDADYDVISLESPKAAFLEDGEVLGIDPITGFAVGRSGEQTPAFPEARLIAAIQCFMGTDDAPVNDQGQQTVEQKTRQEKKMPTIEEVKKAIQDNGWSPSTLFDSNSVLGSIELKDGQIKIEGGDPRITKILEKKISGHVVVAQDEYAKAQEAIKYREQTQAEMDSFRKAKFQGEIKERLTAKAKEAGWTDKQLEYLMLPKNLDTVQPAETVDVALKSYTEKALADFQGNAEFFGAGKPPVSNPATTAGTGLPTDKPYLDI